MKHRSLGRSRLSEQTREVNTAVPVGEIGLHRKAKTPFLDMSKRQLDLPTMEPLLRREGGIGRTRLLVRRTATVLHEHELAATEFLNQDIPIEEDPRSDREFVHNCLHTSGVTFEREGAEVGPREIPAVTVKTGIHAGVNQHFTTIDHSPPCWTLRSETNQKQHTRLGRITNSAPIVNRVLKI